MSCFSHFFLLNLYIFTIIQILFKFYFKFYLYNFYIKHLQRLFRNYCIFAIKIRCFSMESLEKCLGYQIIFNTCFYGSEMVNLKIVRITAMFGLSRDYCILYDAWNFVFILDICRILFQLRSVCSHTGQSLRHIDLSKLTQLDGSHTLSKQCRY